MVNQLLRILYLKMADVERDIVLSQRGQGRQRAGFPLARIGQYRLQAAGAPNNARAIGPILLGMGAPVHVLQTGDEVNDIVQVAAVAAMDAMSRN